MIAIRPAEFESSYQSDVSPEQYHFVILHSSLDYFHFNWVDSHKVSHADNRRVQDNCDL
jgi:hypothetical protein